MSINMDKIIHLVISDDTFGGFEHFYRLPATVIQNDIKMNDIKMNDLVNSIINKLYCVLKNNNLEAAISLLQGKNFHIHHNTIDDLRNRLVNDTVYVCCHTH
jgi:hypothetical protein